MRCIPFRWRLAALLLLLTPLPCPVADADAADAGTVLILHAYHRGYQWTDDISRGIETALTDSRHNVSLYIEYMDTKRFSDPGYYAQLLSIYREKYRHTRPDVVIACDDNALNFMRDHRETLFAGTPLVFCGVNFMTPADLEGLSAVTGVNEKADLKRTLDLALDMHPKTRRIVVVNDSTTTGRKIRGRLDRLMPRYADRVRFTFLDDREMPEIEATLAKLPDDALVLYTIFFRDSAGRFFEFDESASRIAAASPVPVYGLWEFSLGHGIVGGMLTSGYQQGKTAADLALRVLGGEPVDDIPVVWESPNRYMFDFRVLSRFGIDPADLPEGNIIINRPASPYEAYARLFWIGAASIVCLTLVVLALTANIIRRREAEKQLQDAHEHLEALVEDRTRDLEAALDRRRTAQAALKWEVSVSSALAELAGTLISPAPIDEISVLVLKDAKHLTGSTVGYVGYIEPETGHLVCPTMTEAVWDQCRVSEKSHIFTEFSGLWGWVLTHRQPLMTNAPAEAPGASGTPPGHLVIHRFLSVPVLIDKTLVGQISLANPAHGRDYDEGCLKAAERLADLYALAVRRHRDDAEMARLQRQVQQSQKMEAIGTLAGGIAHDFNNILFPIIGFTEMTLDEVAEGTTARKNLSEVLKAADRARDLVRQILAFSRQTETERKPIHIQPIVKESLSLLRASIPRTIDIQRTIDAGCGPVTGDPVQVHQVIMNLCTNAYHAMRESGGVLSVSLAETVIHPADDRVAARSIPPGNYACLTVSDTGAGIPERIQARIFEPYFTTKAKNEGTGIGLSVARGIIESHGGLITLESEPGRGATFQVLIPILQTAPEAAPAPTFAEVPRGDERILLVDDEEMVARMVAQLLDSLGYTVAVRVSPVEALAAFEARPDGFDLVITDQTMPQMTGSEMARRMLAIRPALPIILCTGFSELISEAQARARGIRAYVMKPVVRAEIAAVIREVLDGSGGKRGEVDGEGGPIAE
jgi:signal transduction histidine kinase/CheY-like chemotaxis protein/ABC-type uncharacterized transport system substrate-binding protein